MTINETVKRMHEILVERFGEPIHDQPALVGAADEGSDGKALWDDEPKKDRAWSDPSVVKESDDVTCSQCGLMHTNEEISCEI